MRDLIVGLLDKADLALSACLGVVDEAALEPAAESARNVRVRLSYPEDLLVAAVAGGTGSGKSSVLNAICGAEVAEVGGRRPTTDRPLALVPRARGASVDGYLDEMGVERREPHEVAHWLCLIDMPDTDSVEVEHRLQVDGLLPRLDVVVWVVDPEKYRDAALHHGYLRPLAAYGGQFVFVLNQADRLDQASLEAVVADFRQALAEDGISSSPLVVTSASPPSGPPIGIPELVDALEALATARGGTYAKLLVDLEEAAHTLLDATGEKGLDFEARASSTVLAAARLIGAGEAGEANSLLSDFLTSIAVEAGGPLQDRLQALAASTPRHVQTAADSLSPTGGRWLRWRRGAAASMEEGRVAEAERVLANLSIGPFRDLLRQRAQANAALTELALSVASVRAGKGR